MRLVNIYLWVVLGAIANQAMAEDVKFPVSAISDSLKKNANMVYREDRLEFTILSRSRAVQHAYVAITIMNSKGKRAAQQAVFYSKMISVNMIEGAIYDAMGNRVRKLKSADIADRSASGSSVYQDYRVKAIDLSYSTYPYTIELETEIEYKYLFHTPTWFVVPGEKIAVEKSFFKLEFVPDAKPRYQLHNTELQPQTGKKDGREFYAWTFSNITAMEAEPFGPSISEITPKIETAPGMFIYDEYKGDMNTWAGFGQWILALNKNRDNLPESTKQKVHELIKNKISTEEKVKALYEYLQDRTRYVSIQIGIGGYQPFDAADVDQNSYGDCKALSNYMVALLKEAGIKANYVLINAGRDEDDINISFPRTQFNHAIAAVPMDKDTLWLECTSQTNPFGYSGEFTGNRHALMITDKGGEIVRTVVYPQAVNTQIRRAQVEIDKTGSSQAKVKTVYSGLQYENGHLNYYLNQSKEDQKKWVLENTEIPVFDLKTFSIVENRDKIPQATVDLDLSLRNFATMSGTRMFIAPNLMNRSTYVPPKLSKRTAPIIKTNAYLDEDVIELSFPNGMYPEFMPQPIHHQSRFGVYEASFVMEEGKVIYTRKLKMNSGKFDASTYTELIDFYKNINKADNLKLVFLNKT